MLGEDARRERAREGAKERSKERREAEDRYAARSASKGS